MKEFYDFVNKIILEYEILKKIKITINDLNVSIRKVALELLPNENQMFQTAFLLLVSELEKKDMTNEIIALKLLKISYEIRDKLVNKTPIFSTHFFIKDKIDMNLGLLISDFFISKALLMLYNQNNDINPYINDSIKNVINSRLDVTYLLRSDSLDFKKYTEIIARNLGSILKLGLIFIKPDILNNMNYLNIINNIAINLSIALEFAEDFCGFLKISNQNNGDMSYVLSETTNLFFIILLLIEISSAYESQMLKSILNDIKQKGSLPSNKEIWRIKTLVKKYNVNEYVLNKINEHINVVIKSVTELKWNNLEKINKYLNTFLTSIWNVAYIRI